MSGLQPRSQLPAANGFGVPHGLTRVARVVATPYATLSGKLTRFLARNVVTKRLVMRNPRPLISFTFDDAAASACIAGAMIVEHYQARATFYISGGKCGAASPTGRLASIEQVQAVCAKGHEIACHTFWHTSVVSVSRLALKAELDRNRTFLQDALGNIPLRNFAYPYGAMSFASKRYLGDYFDSCRAHTPGVNAGVADLSVLKSNALETASLGRREITQLIGETVRRNGWLIFASHDVDNMPSRFGVRPDMLAFALRSAREAGCQLVTVAQALRIASGAEQHESGGLT